MEIPAHKMVLSTASQYFDSMFSHFDEVNQDQVTIGGVDSQSMQSIIEYVYTARIEINEDNVKVNTTSALTAF